MKKVKDLPNFFIGKGEVRGFEFSLVKHSDKAYLYEVNTGDNIHYEIFKKESRSNSVIHCRPTSDSYSRWAWTKDTKEEALLKFNELNDKL